MRKREFERLLVSLDGLSQAQLRQVSQKVGSLNERREVQDLTDKRVEALGACPHCGNVEFARWGRTGTGDQRYRCGGCFKTFTSLTGDTLLPGSQQSQAAGERVLHEGPFERPRRG